MLLLLCKDRSNFSDDVCLSGADVSVDVPDELDISHLRGAGKQLTEQELPEDDGGQQPPEAAAAAAPGRSVDQSQPFHQSFTALNFTLPAVEQCFLGQPICFFIQSLLHSGITCRHFVGCSVSCLQDLLTQMTKVLSCL